MIINKEQIDCRRKDGSYGKKIIVSYIDKAGNIKFLQYTVPESEMFKWMYSRKSEADPEWKSYDNKPVKKVPVSYLTENRMNEILCDLCKEMPAVNEIFDMNAPITWACDIETDVDDLGFSPADEARTAVNTISLARYPEVIVWGRKPITAADISCIENKFKDYKADSSDTDIVGKYHFTYRGFTNEADMLMDYFLFIKDIPAICGWNFLSYDWKYLYNRAVKILGLDISFISPTKKFYNFNYKIDIQFPQESVMMPMHKIIYDYMMIYKRWDQTVEIKENDTLDFVSESVLGYKKVKHNLGFQDFYKQEYLDYIFYNAVDSILVDQINKKIKTSNIWYSLTSELHTELNFEFSTVKPAQIVLDNFLHEKKKMIPDMPKKPEEKRAYAGAFVWKTQPGIYKYVGSLDFSSLYPTTIREFNMSTETFKRVIYKELADGNKEHAFLRQQKIEEYRKTKLQKNEILTKSGAIFDNTYQGIIPEVLSFYFKKRKESKAIRKQVDKEAEYLKKILEDHLKKINNSSIKKIDFKYCKLDNAENASTENIQNEIKRLELLSEYYDGKQLAEKKFLNSMYGALANAYFPLANTDIAEAITLQGQDLNHFSENCINAFFIKILPTETEFLKKYNVDVSKPVKIDLSKGRLTPNHPLDKKDPSYSHLKSDYSATVIGDTDSIYVEFGRIANQLGVPIEKQTKFTVDLWNNYISKYMNTCYDSYAKYYQCNKNLELLELEKISSTVLAFSKKHYVLDKCWEEPGIYLDHLSHVSYTGLETIQKGTPTFMRKCQDDFYRFILKKYIKNEKPAVSELLDKLKKYKTEMAVAPIEDICKASSMNNYEKFVLDDKNSLSLIKGCPAHVRASAIYNHELYSNKKYMTRYSFIKSSNKIKWYYTADKKKESFAFQPNNYPNEFAPSIDYDMQFDKLLLEPLNRTVEILGYPKFTPKLCFTNALF